MVTVQSIVASLSTTVTNLVYNKNIHPPATIDAGTSLDKATNILEPVLKHANFSNETYHGHLNVELLYNPD